MPRDPDLGGRQDLGELVVGGLHQRRVERPGDLEGDHPPRAQLQRDRLQRRQGREFPRDDDVARPEEVGLPEPAGGGDPAAKLVDARLVEADDAGHPARRGGGGGLHRLAPAADDLQARLEVERPGEGQRGVLAQAQAGEPGAVPRRGRGRSASDPSSAARLLTKMAGWLMSVASRASLGPSKQTCLRSNPRTSHPRGRKAPGPRGPRRRAHGPSRRTGHPGRGTEEGDLGHRRESLLDTGKERATKSTVVFREQICHRLVNRNPWPKRAITAGGDRDQLARGRWSTG